MGEVLVSIKNPATCASAIFDKEEDSDVVFFSSCSAWRLVEALDFKSLGIERSDTWVRKSNGDSFQACANSIGEKAALMCEGCDRYKLKVTSSAAWSGPSDPEYCPDPA